MKSLNQVQSNEIQCLNYVYI